MADFFNLSLWEDGYEKINVQFVNIFSCFAVGNLWREWRRRKFSIAGGPFCHTDLGTKSRKGGQQCGRRLPGLDQRSADDKRAMGVWTYSPDLDDRLAESWNLHGDFACLRGARCEWRQHRQLQRGIIADHC
jgi:hypothetical protein